MRDCRGIRRKKQRGQKNPLIFPEVLTFWQQTKSVGPTGASRHTVPTCSGHIDRRSERYGDNRAGMIKLMASKVRFLAMPASARNPVDFAILATDIPKSLLTLDY